METHPAVAQPPPSPADRGASLDRTVFGVVVEPAPDADRDGVPDTATALPAAEHRGPGGDRTVRDVGSPIPDRGR